MGIGLIFNPYLWKIPKTWADTCTADYVCHQALVKFSRQVSEVEIRQRLLEINAKILNFFPQSRLYHLQLSKTADTLTQITELRSQKGILLAEPNDRIYAQILPDDPDFSMLWGLQNLGQTLGLSGTDIAIETVWDNFTDGSDVIVAVIDSGVDYEHPDLSDNIWTSPGEIPNNAMDDDGNGYVDDVHGYDFVDDDGDPMDGGEHGTHVAGILGAVGNNGIGISGVIWSAKIMPVRFLNSANSGTVSNAILAIEYAVTNGAKILNNSWGGGPYNKALLNAILAADAQGVLFFAAAGNQGVNTDQTPFYPASINAPNLLSVASIDDKNTLSTFSNYGKLTVDLAAPGTAIFSTKPNDTYGYISGTSMATPHASGVAALLWSQFPQLNHRQIRNLLLQGVEPEDYLADITVMGGRLNAELALAVATDPDNQAPLANAGSDQSNELGQVISLHGSATDPDGDSPLIYQWTLNPPPESNTKLYDDFAQDPSFIPDREGEYTATLYVSDSLSTSVPAMTSITIAGGILPLPTVIIKTQAQFTDGTWAELTNDLNVILGTQLLFKGGESHSIFPEDLTFFWELVATPPNSQAQLKTENQNATQFKPDLPGVYTVRLTIDDGYQENFNDVSLTVLAAAIPEPSEAPTPTPAPPSPASGCALRKY